MTEALFKSVGSNARHKDPPLILRDLVNYTTVQG